jgi:S1-C subfamily serine protease
MFSTTFPLLCPNSKSWFARIVFVIGFVCSFLFVLVVNMTTTYADGIPGGNVSDPVVRKVDISRPAVVRIITSISGRLTVHFAPTSQSATFPLSGGSYSLQLSGSGTFISANGDILTADHVVNPPHDQSLNEFLYEQAGKDIANYINQHFTVSPPFTKDNVVFELESGSFPSTSTYTSAKSEVYLSTQYTGSLNASKLADVAGTVHAHVDRIEQESSFDKNDVAIVHVSNMNDMPSIQLGDSSGVQEQDNLTIIGFPGSGDVNDAPTYFLSSSVNKVFVSAMKMTGAGAPVIQVGGNVEHGDSGGPALDEQGNVVGIVSFGLDIPNASGETSFLQASNSAKALIQELNLNTSPGHFQTAWNQALTDYASNAPGHWQKTQKELQQIASQYPLFQAITPYLTFAQTQAKSERLPQSQPQSQIDVSSIILIVGIIIVVLMVLALFAVVFAMRRGKKATPAAPIQSTSTQTPADAVAQNNQMNRVYSTSPGSLPDFTPPLFLPAGDKPGQFVSQSSTSGKQSDEARAPGPPSMAAWSFPAPAPAQSSPGQVISLSACGHLNTNDASFCRTCGNPIVPGYTFGLTE